MNNHSMDDKSNDTGSTRICETIYKTLDPCNPLDMLMH